MVAVRLRKEEFKKAASYELLASSLNLVARNSKLKAKDI